MTRLLTVLGGKGGIGKSTIAANLLVAARLDGIDAAGLDLDAQRSFARWAEERQAQGREPACRVATGSLLAWREAIPKAKLVVVDTPPGIAAPAEMDAIRGLARESGLVLMPALPEAPTLTSLGDVGRELAEEADAVFVLNRAIPGRAILAEARAYLRDRAELCEVEIPQRDHMQRAMDAGSAVVEDARLGGAAQAAALWRYATTRLGIM